MNLFAFVGIFLKLFVKANTCIAYVPYQEVIGVHMHPRTFFKISNEFMWPIGLRFISCYSEFSLRQTHFFR